MSSLSRCILNGYSLAVDAAISCKAFHIGMVQGTNDSSIVSKCSMAKLGYFKDDYLQHFVSKTCRRSPLINRGYYVRQKAVHHILTMFLARCDEDNMENHCQIISLGAGFDSSYFRLEADNVLNKAKFIEIDFPEVAQRKHLLIKKHHQLFDLCKDLTKCNRSNDDPVFISAKYSLIGCDLRRVTRLKELLVLCGVSFDTPTLLLSECVLTYLDPESATGVISFFQRAFPDSVFISYEQILPNDAFGIVMQKHFNRLNSPLKCINAYPTKPAQIQRLETLGYPSVSFIDMNQFYNTFIDIDERQRIDTIEPFDEFEEWHLKCAHYCLISGYQGVCRSFQSYMFNGDISTHTKEDVSQYVDLSIIEDENDDNTLLSRFGHSMCCLPNNDYVITGGFGLNGTKHERLNNATGLSKQNIWKSNLLALPNSHPLCDSRMFHTISLIDKDHLFIFGGRVSPTKPCSTSYIINLCKDHIPPEETGNEFNNFGNENIAIHSGDSCPETRWRHTTVTIPVDEDSNDLIIFGGRTSSILGLSDIWRFSGSSRMFHKLSSEEEIKTIGRHSHAACNIGSKMIVYGGLNRESKPMSLIESYSFMNGKYQQTTLPLHLPERYSHTMHVYNQCVFVVGGVCLDDTMSAGTMIDIDELISTPLRYNINSMKPLMLHNHTSAVTNDGDIIIVGGGGNCFSFGTHFNQGVHKFTIK